MKKARNPFNRLGVYLTTEEKEKFDKITERLRNEFNISKQRQSEIIMQGFFELADKLISSRSPHTQTIQQLNEKEVKLEVLNKIKDFINTKPKEFKWVFNNFFIHYAKQLGSHRTRFTWLKQLFESDEFLLLNIRPYFKDYIVIPKHSFWHAQFKDHCFSLPVNKLDYQPTSTNAAKKKIYNYLDFNHLSASLDKVEDFAAKMFKAYMDETEKPMYPEPIYSEVIELRANWKHREAIELLRKEKQHKEAQKIKIETDAGLQFLAAIEAEEEE